MKEKPSKEQVGAWKARVKELREAIRPIEDELQKLQTMITAAEAKFAVGDVVEWENRIGLKTRGTVVSIQELCGGPKKVYRIKVIKKDGTDGPYRDLYPWHEPTLVTSGITRAGER